MGCGLAAGAASPEVGVGPEVWGCGPAAGTSALVGSTAGVGTAVVGSRETGVGPEACVRTGFPAVAAGSPWLATGLGTSG